MPSFVNWINIYETVIYVPGSEMDAGVAAIKKTDVDTCLHGAYNCQYVKSKK